MGREHIVGQGFPVRKIYQGRARGGIAYPYGADARDENEMVALFEQVERKIGPIEVAVYSVGGPPPAPFSFVRIRPRA